MTGAVAAAAMKMAASLRQKRRELQLAAPQAQLVAGVKAIVDPTDDEDKTWSGGPNPTTAVHILDRSLDLLRPLFEDSMKIGADDAAGDYHYVDPAKTPDYSSSAQERSEYQAQHIQKLHDDIRQAKKDNQSLDQFLGRIASYADALVGAYNAGYAGAVIASAPDVKIIWELGATEHCAACLNRAGKEFTAKSLPGYPGDGTFGGDICEGGPKCGCSLNFVKNGSSASRGTNTQRADAIQWYDQQLANAEQRREDNAEARSDFVSSLPEGPQSRAVARDRVREDAAATANSAARYQGVTFEPRDIPAATVAAGVRKYSESQPRGGDGKWVASGGPKAEESHGGHGDNPWSGEKGLSESSDRVYAARANAESGPYQLTGNGDAGVGKILTASSMPELMDAARTQWAGMGRTFSMDPGLHTMETPQLFESVKSSTAQLASLMKAYPEGAANVRWSTKENMLNRQAYAYTDTPMALMKSTGKRGPSGQPSTIVFNGVDFAKGDVSDPTAGRFLSGGPKGTSFATVVATHEFGHVLDGLGKYQGSAYANAGKFSQSEINRLSSYAKTGGHETAAEAFADVTVNGHNAASTSWKITRALIGAIPGNTTGGNPVAWTVGGTPSGG